MDEDSNLEEELEQELLLEPEEKLPLSTPRQRLEEARAMADGSYDVVASGGEGYSGASKSANGGDEEEQQSSMHLLQVRCVSKKNSETGLWIISVRTAVDHGVVPEAPPHVCLRTHTNYICTFWCADGGLSSAMNVLRLYDCGSGESTNNYCMLLRGTKVIT